MRDPIQCGSDYFTAAVLDACHRHEEGVSSRTGRRAKARPGRGRTLPASLLSDLLREIAPKTRDAERMARAKLPVLPACFDARLLYGAAPEAFLAAGRPAEALSRAVEQLFFRRRRNSAMALAIAQGATLVMVAAALGAGGPAHGEEALRGIEPGLRITLRKLLVKLGWSGEDGAFTDAGREFLHSDAVRDAVRYRSVLASLAAHPDVRLRVPMPDALRTSGGAFDRYLGRYPACIDDMLDLVASWRDPAGGARPSVAVFDAAGESIASRALRSLQAGWRGANGHAESGIAFFGGEQAAPTSVFASGPDSASPRHAVVVAGNRPVSPVGAVAPDAELYVLADEQLPCLDARGRLVDPVSLLTAWQEDLRAWAAVEPLRFGRLHLRGEAGVDLRGGEADAYVMAGIVWRPR
ncbi:MAG: hypothetical protein F9K41_13860 [Sphingopyxis terrae]|nr:MAG: hypothetical protein F9K41_13860 [Sphingopyxis terrae]